MYDLDILSTKNIYDFSEFVALKVSKNAGVPPFSIWCSFIGMYHYAKYKYPDMPIVGAFELITEEMVQLGPTLSISIPENPLSVKPCGSCGGGEIK